MDIFNGIVRVEIKGFVCEEEADLRRQRTVGANSKVPTEK